MNFFNRRLIISLAATAAVFAAFTVRSQTTCLATSRSTSYVPGVNADLGDYGVFFEEAANPTCSAVAASQMLSKINNTLGASGFSGWLEGVNVSLIFSSALQMGAQATLSADLDSKLQLVRDRYNTSHVVSGSCGVSGASLGDSCMDDYSIEAAAYAWIAAYEAKSGRSADAYVAKTKNSISLALSPDKSVCLYTYTQPTTCIRPTNIAQALASGAVEATSYNHNQQNPTYGVGLMTSISSAAVALELAGSSYAPTADERAIALALLEDGQKKSLPDGSDFKMNCYDLNGGPIVDCGDPGFSPNYQPKMFPVNRFYQRFFGLPANTVVDPIDSLQPQTAYQFGQFDGSLFNDANSFFHAGREVIYRDLADTWWVNRPALAGYGTNASGPTLSTNKAIFAVTDTFTLTVADASPYMPVEFLWWKNDVPYDGGCGTGIWCVVGNKTDASGNWIISGTYDASLIGQWRERARIGSAITNDIVFMVQNSGVSGAPPSCANPSPMPTGYVPPCPILSVSPTSLSSSQSITVSLIPPSGTVWIYKTLYITEGSTWKAFTLPGNVQYTYWLTGNVSYNLTPSSSGVSLGVHYLASWEWTWDAAKQCYLGPGSTACNQGQYRLQQVTVQ